MTKTQTTEFDNELKALSMGVYKGNGKVVIAMRGTNDKNDLANDVDMAKKKLPNQYVDAQKFYEKVKKDFPNQEI